MAVFSSDLAFNYKTMNFNTGFQGALEVIDRGSVPFGLDPIPIPVRGITAEIPGFQVTVDNALSITSGDFITGVLGDRLSYTAEGVLTGGRVHGILGVDAGLTAFSFLGFNSSASDFNEAAHTRRTGDDRAFVNDVISGNDMAILSSFNDVFKSGAGKDVIIDQGGNDKIYAGTESDFIFAGGGRDWVVAGWGNDLVIGAGGNDRLFGDGGRDVIWAGKGHDVVAGGAGRDDFVFAKGDGTANIITDFEVGTDEILYLGKGRDLKNLEITDDISGLTVSFSNVSVVLQGVHLDDGFSADDVRGGARTVMTNYVNDFLTDWTFIA